MNRLTQNLTKKSFHIYFKSPSREEARPSSTVTATSDPAPRSEPSKTSESPVEMSLDVTGADCPEPDSTTDTNEQEQEQPSSMFVEPGSNQDEIVQISQVAESDMTSTGSPVLVDKTVLDKTNESLRQTDAQIIPSSGDKLPVDLNQPGSPNHIETANVLVFDENIESQNKETKGESEISESIAGQDSSAPNEAAPECVGESLRLE